MENYSFLRQFADSWMLLFLTLFFVGVVIWVLTRKRGKFDDAANSIFRHQDQPASDKDEPTRDENGKA
ncbi:cbb3-type cytochrome c oxidase subunit 3 [Qingshengfaniella alkalisoli]|uniref:Cbb3-type cytochrome c oxidase subunit 3 n=1 Tax=Qingshengfaniella alkalisoli TaxID=2599296 RepID=A0A5B8J0B0_9RHOB|nr:cbb3-type cytochrome c oxidase subunit 3 [Qingshengfaniella alkalisoli]QDY71223.1 cbb3-type cytochrome c oxidase subunit 3 [Qingshengfaniella alkalisoli]